MARVEFTREAQADLRAIVAYTVETWSAAQAVKYVAGLEALCAQIAGMPRMGQRAPELGGDLRCFPYESHVIYYQPAEDGILVIAVVHKRQNPRLRLID